MQGNPMDMFDEMDEMFARIFSRIDREFMDDFHPGYGHRIVITGDEEEPDAGENADAAALPAPVNGEPVAEVHRIGDEVLVIVNLPGITGEALRLGMRGNTLVIDAGDADHHYRTSATLPPVDKASLRTSLKNGVLEVTFRAAD